MPSLSPEIIVGVITVIEVDPIGWTTWWHF